MEVDGIIQVDGVMLRHLEGLTRFFVDFRGGHRALLRIPGFRGFRNATVCKVTAAWRACFHPAADWVAQSKCKVGAETEIAQGQPVEGNQCK
eukprot:350652-Amorphochlora_amoeboformis.AAC.1